MFQTWFEENISRSAGEIFHVMSYIFIFFFLISGVFAAVRRLHDLDRPGLDYFFLLIPIVNIFHGFELYLKKGTDGPNKYGDDPLAVENKSTENGFVSQYLKKNAGGVYGTMIIAAAFTLFITIYKDYFKNGIFTPEKIENYRIPVQEAASSDSEYTDADFRTTSSQETSEKYIIRYETLHSLVADLYMETSETKKLIDIGTDSSMNTLTFIKGKHGIVMALEIRSLIPEYKSKLEDFGFSSASLIWQDSMKTPKNLGFKEYWHEHDLVHLQVGTDMKSIHYFVNYILENFYGVARDSALTVQIR